MKKVLLLLGLVLIMQGCNKTEIGPYATDAFNEKYSHYADFYNLAVYSGQGIGAWMDEYDLAFYSGAEPNFENQLMPIDLSAFSTALQYAKEWSAKEPLLDTLDDIVRRSVATSEQLLLVIQQVEEYYGHGHYSEDNYAWIKANDPKLQSLVNELSPLFSAMESELVRLRQAADDQLITRYETSGDDLSANLVRVMRLYDSFSVYVTNYALDEAVDLNRFENEIAQTDSLRTELVTLSESAKNLKKSGRTKAQLDQFADTILQGEQTLRHILGTMREGNALQDEDMVIFETIYNSMVEQLNQVNE